MVDISDLIQTQWPFVRDHTITCYLSVGDTTLMSYWISIQLNDTSSGFTNQLVG